MGEKLDRCHPVEGDQGVKLAGDDVVGEFR